MTLTRIEAITMFVADPRRSREFYVRVFGVQPLFEDDSSVAFQFDGVVINLLAVSSAPELIQPASVAQSGSPSSFQMTVGVDDVDEACANLASKGVELLNGPMDRSWGIRTATFTDPDGHIWEIAAPLRKA